MIRSFAASTLFVIAATLVGCGGESSEHRNHEHFDEHGSESHEDGIVALEPAMLERITIRTAVATMRALPSQLQTTGKVDFDHDRLAHVTPRIPGRVERAPADLGATVRQGDVLAVIDSIDLGQARSDFLQVLAQEELARQNAEREERLFREHISSEKEMLAARAAHLETIARLRSSQETLRLYGLTEEQIDALSYEDGRRSLLPVRAPLAGRVVEKHVTVGELVTPDRSMFTIADLGHVWIWIDVYEQDLRNVHLDDDVVVEVDAYPGERFGGQVSYLSDQVEVDTRTVRARIDVDNPARKLRPGMFARVTLTDPHSGDADVMPSLVVPAAAVQRDGTELVVFVPLGQNRFERREVTTGRKAGGFVEILSGLEPDLAVVVEGTFLLKSEASKGRMGVGHAH